MEKMAKFILNFFGGAALLTGVIAIVNGVMNAKDAATVWSIFLAASGALMFGAALLGFARIIDLLEDIRVNTHGLRVVPKASDPRPGNLSTVGSISQGKHQGYAYTLHGDGVVVSRIADAPHTWRNETEFRAWADAHPAE